MILFPILLLMGLSQAFSQIQDIFQDFDKEIVLRTRRYEFEKYPGAFNPSLIQIKEGQFLLTFRYTPDPEHQDWLSFIGIVPLDAHLNPTEPPTLLNTRRRKSKTPSQSEDARIFSFNGKLFVIYNDNVDEMFFHFGKRRDMFIAELNKTETGYQLSPPLKLHHEANYHKVLHQKNWIPFEWNQKLYISYTIQPHEVLEIDLKTGLCSPVYTTVANLEWMWGNPRGSTPPILVDGEYLAFFHSSIKICSPASHQSKMWHYFMGAYTFSTEAPFALTKISDKPMIHPDFYTPSYRDKRVIFPGGFVVQGSSIHIAYGKDDCEIWIATIDKEKLVSRLKHCVTD